MMTYTFVIEHHPWVGSTYESSPLADGTPRHIGSSSDGLALLELTGPADNLTGASVMVTLGVPRDIMTRNGVNMTALLDETVPKWSGRKDWLVNAIGRATDVPVQRTTQDGKLIKLEYFDALDSLILSVERR